MPDPIVTSVISKPKRTRKPSKPRTPRVKDEAILAIEAQAKAAKDEYRKSQASGGVLKRIVEKMLPRLSPGDIQRLSNALSDLKGPVIPVPSGDNPVRTPPLEVIPLTPPSDDVKKMLSPHDPHSGAVYGPK